MDVLDMKFKTGSFDCVIDKAVLDALACGPQKKVYVDKMVSEIYRVLKPDGVYISVTHGT